MGVIRVAALIGAVALLFQVSAAHAEGDAAKGKKVFNKCKSCHSMEAGKNKIGPSLNGIVGRTAGTVEGFKYSDVMKNSGIEWTVENLDGYLTKPKEFMPDNKMTFVGLKKEAQRQDVIAYMMQEGQ